MNNEQIIRLLKLSALEVYRSTLIGSPPERAKRLFQELTNPNPGDLVLEVTTCRMKGSDPREGIGRLIRIADEPSSTREEWMEAGGEPDEEIPTNRVFYIRLEFDDNREFRWHNASFIKVLEEPFRC